MVVHGVGSGAGWFSILKQQRADDLVIICSYRARERSGYIIDL
jgi:hypothetical protein